MVFVHNINPVLVKLFGFEIRYYGLFYIIGLLIGYFFLVYLAKKKGIKLTKDDVLDYIVYLAFGILIGSRLFYFIFYDIKQIFVNPLEIFALWHGGMSFHGGLIGSVIASWLYCRIKKIDIMQLADIVVIPLGLALCLGRIGNFINGELFGRITSLPWAVDFGDGIPRHPSQLYEAGKNLIIFFTLFSLRNKKLPRGFLFWLFVTMYGTLRFFIEFVREPDSQLGFFWLFTMGQILCFVMIVVGVFMLIRLWKKK